MTMEQSSPKRVVEDITVPGLVLTSTGIAKAEDLRIRFQLFTIGAGGEGAEDDSLALEALLNREDVIVVDYHKYTFQHTFHVAVTYSEPAPKKASDKKKSDLPDLPPIV